MATPKDNYNQLYAQALSCFNIPHHHHNFVFITKKHHVEVKDCKDLVFDDVLIILSRNEKEQIFPANNSFESLRAEEAMHGPEESISDQEDLESLRISYNSEDDLQKSEETNQIDDYNDERDQSDETESQGSNQSGRTLKFKINIDDIKDELYADRTELIEKMKLWAASKKFKLTLLIGEKNYPKTILT